MGGACVIGGVVVNVRNVGVVNVGVVPVVINVGVVVLGSIVLSKSTCRFAIGLLTLHRSLSQHCPLRFDVLRPISVGIPDPNNRVQT
jgi:hypothetical protein